MKRQEWEGEAEKIIYVDGSCQKSAGKAKIKERVKARWNLR